MRSSITRVSYSLALLILLSAPSVWAADNQGVEKAINAFLQEFYNWYAPLASNPKLGRASDIAIRERESVFSSELRRLLKEDSIAQENCRELIGLDFDPFLVTAYSDERIEIGQIRRHGNFYRAEVYSLESGKRRNEPNATAELSISNGQWSFVNLYYPSGGDLLGALKLRPECMEPRSSQP